MSRARTYTTSWAWLGLTNLSYHLVKLTPNPIFAFANTLFLFSSQYFELPIPVVLPLLGRYSSLQSGAYLVQISASIYDRVGRLSISYIEFPATFYYLGLTY